jgi:hypothetical protein
MRVGGPFLMLLLFAGWAEAAQSLWTAAGGLPPDAIPSPYGLVDSAEPEDPVLGGGMLTISTSADAAAMYYIQSGAALAPPDPWVIEFEMRHVSGSSSTPLRAPATVFVTTSPDVGMLMQIGADSVFLLADVNTMGASATVDTDDAFHTYRMEVAANGAIDVYYDDALTLQGSTYTSATSHGAVPRVAFGAASQLSQGVSEWRSFAHDGLATSNDAQINVNIAGTGANPMHPTETAGAPGTNDDNWNNLAGTLTAAGPLDLVGGDGLPIAGATASWTGNGVGILNDGGGTDDTHLRSTNFDANSYPAVDVTVSGVPYARYDVYAYHEGGSPMGVFRVAHFNIGAEHRFALRPTDFEYAESPATTDQGVNTPAGNYVVFRGLTASSFTLTAGGGSASDGTPRNRFSAVQIVEALLTTTTTTTTSTSVTSSTSTSMSTTTLVSTSSSSTSTSTTTSVPASTTTTTLVGQAVLLPGKKLQVKQKKSGVQRLQVLTKDAGIAAASPCEVAGELIVEAVGAGAPVQRVSLEATFWKPINAKKPERGCKYRKGPVVATVLLKAGKVLKIVANATDLGIPLATDPRPIRLELRHGDVRHCLEFGGQGRHKPGQKLLSRNAAVAAACPSGSLSELSP